MGVNATLLPTISHLFSSGLIVVPYPVAWSNRGAIFHWASMQRYCRRQWRGRWFQHLEGWRCRWKCTGSAAAGTADRARRVVRQWRGRWFQHLEGWRCRWKCTGSAAAGTADRARPWPSRRPDRRHPPRPRNSPNALLPAPPAPPVPVRRFPWPSRRPDRRHPPRPRNSPNALLPAPPAPPVPVRPASGPCLNATVPGACPRPTTPWCRRKKRRTRGIRVAVGQHPDHV